MFLENIFCELAVSPPVSVASVIEFHFLKRTYLQVCIKVNLCIVMCLSQKTLHLWKACLCRGVTCSLIAQSQLICL